MRVLVVVLVLVIENEEFEDEDEEENEDDKICAGYENSERYLCSSVSICGFPPFREPPLIEFVPISEIRVSSSGRQRIGRKRTQGTPKEKRISAYFAFFCGSHLWLRLDANSR